MIALVKQRFDYLDVLINNAGVYSEQRHVTSEGLENTYAVNVFVPYLMMTGLSDLLTKTNGGRIVNVGSVGERYGKLTDLQSTTNYEGNTAYNQSKLALILLTYQFAKAYHPDQLTVNCIHPGPTKTKLVKKPDVDRMPFLLRLVFLSMSVFRRSPALAAADIVKAALHPDYNRITGVYIDQNKIRKSSLQSYRTDLMADVFQYCQRIKSGATWR